MASNKPTSERGRRKARQQSNGRDDFLVVGSGASAGGIQALKQFFANVPLDGDMAYVVALPMSPEYESKLAEILQAIRAIPVTQVRDRIKIHHDSVYVIPPQLQSVNEELTTVNQELKIKIEELSHANNDFSNLMNSTDIGTIFLDRDFKVKLFTPRARDAFNLISSDTNRPLADITHRLKYD
ncbi:MAG TPA: chemotaxis protein CheB, partial [Pyrinomonadaceae bacterium]|nr:chemotaxis protein CheB [Pyrinomonadaceae bacterium]